MPGCYASGFIGVGYPLVKEGILPADYPVSVFAVSGYSGGGKKLIAAYEEEGRDPKFDSARMYAWGQSHKHLKEMKAITGLAAEPLFCPLTTNYHSGMIVQVPLFTDRLNKKMTPEELRDFFAEYYKGEKFNLPDFVDPATGFISYKSKDGKELKALELPGLWNGAMSDWNTIMVEVPLTTFNPVKTVNDLLRPQHQKE